MNRQLGLVIIIPIFLAACGRVPSAQSGANTVDSAATAVSQAIVHQLPSDAIPLSAAELAQLTTHLRGTYAVKGSMKPLKTEVSSRGAAGGGRNYLYGFGNWGAVGAWISGMDNRNSRKTIHYGLYIPGLNIPLTFGRVGSGEDR